MGVDVQCWLSQGGISLCLLVVLFHPLCHRISYEIFLRTHQALAALFFYSTWRHLPSDRLFPRIYLYIFSGMFLATLSFETGSILYWNYAVRRGCSQALLMLDSRSSISMVTINIRLSKPLQVKAGQYINSWIPSVSAWSFLQSHPFVVISWAEGKQDNLQLIVEPRKGLSGKLLCHAKNNRPRFVLFSGPYGRSAAVDDYEVVLLVADGFGIAAILPYLKKPIHGYNNRKACTQRIHLVWQIQNIGKPRTIFRKKAYTIVETGIAIQPILNHSLDEDNYVS